MNEAALSRRVWLALLAFFGASRASAAQPPRFPTLSGETLNRAPIVLPAELPGRRTLLLIAFKQEQQYVIDGWIAGMSLRTSSIPWLELPVVPNYGALFRIFLDNAMRSGIPDTAARARVVTLYTSQSDFCQALGLPGIDQIYALVVDRQGNVLARADGEFDAAAAARLLAALNRS